MLAHVITAANRALYGRLLTAIYRQRHDIFVVRKRWNLTSHNGLERDAYDDAEDVVYMAVVDDAGELVGSQRFLPGDKPNVSNGPLRGFWDKPPPRGPDAWEVSRTVVARDWDWPDFAECCAALGAGEIEWAMGRGIRTIFGVGDARFVGAMVQLGWDVEMHGLAREYPEGGRGVAVSWPITLETLKRSRASYGFERVFCYEAPPQLEARDMEPHEFAYLAAVTECDAPAARRHVLDAWVSHDALAVSTAAE